MLYELLKREPLVRGQTDAELVGRIFDVCGTPKLSAASPCAAADPAYRFDVWPGVAACEQWPLYRDLEARPRALQERFGGDAHEARPGNRPPRCALAVVGQPTPLAVDLVERLLCLDPEQRATARDALGHDYFHNPHDPVRSPDQYA